MVSQELGAFVRRIPDGEVGERFHWVLFQGAVFEQTPGLKRLGESPVILAGVDMRPFTLDGTREASEINFPELGYAAAALESYAIFQQLRAAGEIRPGTRFQVSLPTPLAPISTFVHPDAREALERPYADALAAEITRIQEGIAHADLAIQFDLAIEFAYLETAAGREPSFPSEAWFDPVLDGLADRAAAMIERVPAGVEVGLHLCYGDVGEKHFIEPLDASLLTALANAISGRVTRPLTWLHVPVPIGRTDPEYFAPLADLSAGFEELYLGLIHLADGSEGARARIAAAQRSGISEFGIAAECGFGRGAAELLLDRLRLHAEVAQPLPTAR